MGDSPNALIGLEPQATRLTPDAREMDVLRTAGERIL